MLKREETKSGGMDARQTIIIDYRHLATCGAETCTGRQLQLECPFIPFVEKESSSGTDNECNVHASSN